MKLIVVLLLLMTSVVIAQPVITHHHAPAPVGAAHYYVAANGNDSNQCTQTSPWLSPKHDVNCGDTLHLAPGSGYNGRNFDLGRWGHVANCPSSTGRNTAKLICDGSYLQDCSFLHVFQSFRVDQPHWAVQGIYCSSDQVIWSTCFGNTAPFVLFINDYVNAAGAGTGMGDYGAMIGMLVYGSGFGGGESFSGLSVFKPTEIDQQPGTHIFVAGSFYLNNKNNPGGTDGEAIIIDTVYYNKYHQQIAIDNNMLIGNGSNALEVFGNASSTGNARVIFRHNTTYGNALSGVGTPHEISLSPVGTWSWCGNVLIDSNLILSTVPTAQVGTIWADAIFDNYCSQVTISNSFVGAANGRFIGGEPMTGVFLPTQIDVTKANPNFVYPHLLTAAPDCRTKTSTVDCMAQLIADFTPRATGAVGLGYQKPGACAPNPDWPPWIGPGDVPDGIITKPCGM
jgi:hypothetical protein